MFYRRVLKVYFVKVVFCVAIINKCFQITGTDNVVKKPTIPDDKTVQELEARLIKRVADWEFTLKPYSVTTDDGYILKIHRLVKDEQALRSPVLVMHGIAGCSPNFLALRKSIAYHLAEEGYDVWVGNARGTVFSLRHNTSKPNQRKFWNFSFHEIGVYDVPAFLEEIQHRTGSRKVHYVGFSMGTTVFLVMGSERSDVLRRYVASVSLLAPVARPRYHASIKTRPKRYASWILLKLFRLVGRGDIFAYHKRISMAKYRICSSRMLSPLCERMFRGNSIGKDIFDHEGSLELLPFYPCGASIKSYLHYIQLAAEGKFQQYDYGKRKNKLIYKQPKPLQYDIGSIDKTLYLFVGGEDNIADKRDVEWLEARLHSSVRITKDLKHFDHRDFEQGSEIRFVYNVVEEIIKSEDEKREPQMPKDVQEETHTHSVAETKLSSGID